MALRKCAFVAALFVVSAGFARAQTQDRAEDAGTAAATSLSTKNLIPAGGCVTFNYANDRAAFNYTAFLGLAKLPAGCKNGDINILKQYTTGSCPETRANNYPVPSLKIANDCTDPITKADAQTCVNAFDKAPKEAFALASIGAGSMVDEGKVCWAAPETYFFVRNNCKAPITAVIKLTTDRYTGDCTDSNDTDDGGDDVGGTANVASAATSGARSLAAGAAGSCAAVGLLLAALQL